MIEPGDCIVSHPRWNSSGSVCLLTEVNRTSTVALTLNSPAEFSLGELVIEKGYEIDLWCPVYTGGNINQNALIMLHDSGWYSSNTYPINSDWSISSDNLMIDKLAGGNTPMEYRAMLGVCAWEAGELESLCGGNRPRWLILKQPKSDLVLADADRQYDLALRTYATQRVDKLFT